jgi:hypothetical protein
MALYVSTLIPCKDHFCVAADCQIEAERTPAETRPESTNPDEPDQWQSFYFTLARPHTCMLSIMHVVEHLEVAGHKLPLLVVVHAVEAVQAPEGRAARRKGIIVRHLDCWGAIAHLAPALA